MLQVTYTIVTRKICCIGQSHSATKKNSDYAAGRCCYILVNTTYTSTAIAPHIVAHSDYAANSNPPFSITAQNEYTKVRCTPRANRGATLHAHRPHTV